MTNRVRQGEANRKWGKEAENIAADYLRLQGYVIRAQNWRLGNTVEIDLIAEKDGVIAFIEVKARSGKFILGEDAVDEKKMKRMIRGGDAYLRSLSFLYKYRLDMIVITGTPDDYKITHYPDAFLPSVG